MAGDSLFGPIPPFDIQQGRDGIIRKTFANRFSGNAADNIPRRGVKIMVELPKDIDVELAKSDCPRRN